MEILLGFPNLDYSNSYGLDGYKTNGEHTVGISQSPSSPYVGQYKNYTLSHLENDVTSPCIPRGRCLLRMGSVPFPDAFKKECRNYAHRMHFIVFILAYVMVVLELRQSILNAVQEGVEIFSNLFLLA